MQFRNPFFLRLGWSGLRFPEQFWSTPTFNSTLDRSTDSGRFLARLKLIPLDERDERRAWRSGAAIALSDLVFHLSHRPHRPDLGPAVAQRLVTLHQEFDRIAADRPEPHGACWPQHGSILARMQVIDSGDDFFRAYFTKRVEQFDLSERIENGCALASVHRLPSISASFFSRPRTAAAASRIFVWSDSSCFSSEDR